MSERPILKLKLPKSKGIKNDPAPDQPTNPGTGKKLKIKFGGPKSAAPADSDAPRPSPKIVFKKNKNKEKEAGGAAAPGKSKKRAREEDGAATAKTKNGVPASASTVKRLKLTSKSTPKTPTTPFIRLKAKGKPPIKPMGIGYDSEASDAEEDPHIEEEFILRMQPGEDCEYVRAAIASKNWGPVSQGGADVKLKFLRNDGRRAVLAVRGRTYAASMLDLPCVVEGMKSWDKKAWWKTADICQMLLVLGPVKSEEEAQAYPLPEADVRKGSFMYEHGLTPPMKWVRKRRFRKRVSTNIVMQVEQEVDDLFKRDSEALISDYKLQSWDEIEEEQRLQQQQQSQQQSQQMEDYFDEDADGEFDDQVEYDGSMVLDAEGEDEEDSGDWEALMEEAEEAESQAATPGGAANIAALTDLQTSCGESETPVTPGGAITAVIDATDEAETPAAQEEAEESGSDADEDDVDEDADEEELEIRRKKDEIVDLKNAIAEKIAGLAKIGSVILRNRQAAQIKSLQEDLERQKAAIGEDWEDDDEE